MGAGRPTKYKPEYCKQIIDYFTVEPYQGNGKIAWANDLPLFEGFADSIDVHVDTLHEWKKVYPEFSEAYKKAQQKQKVILITNCNKGYYDRVYGIFLSKNITDMRDQQDIKFEDETDKEEIAKAKENIKKQLALINANKGKSEFESND